MKMEPFIEVLPIGEHPSIRHIRGSNFVTWVWLRIGATGGRSS
jgi:hypothetical protein